MQPVAGTLPEAGPAPQLSLEERRWLHDKYERLWAEESQLSSSRTSYYAAIGTVLITGLVVATADLYNEPKVLLPVVTFLSTLGLLISFVWAVLLHRTNDAQLLWREAALRIEQSAPPLPGVWNTPIRLRHGGRLQGNLLRPFEIHDERFGRTKQISWMDRVDPSTLTELLPVVFLLVWVAVLTGYWVWFLFLR